MKKVKTLCPICKRTGIFGLMKDKNGNLMCKWCYIQIYRANGDSEYTIENLNPNITITNDDLSKLKDD